MEEKNNMEVSEKIKGIRQTRRNILTKERLELRANKEITLGEIVQPRREKVLPKNFPNLPYVGLEHIEPHMSRLIGTVLAKKMRSNANHFYPGDVLYSRLRPYLNKVWRADREGLCSAEFIVMPGNERVDSDFLRYRLISQDFVSFSTHLNTGDRPRVDFGQISDFKTWLPDTLEEQRHIVSEIEKQFTRLDAGVAALNRARANLKRYRAAVLKAACEGRLVPTEAELARKEGRTFETGEQLLARILEERRKGWQGKGKYKEPVGPDKNDLPKLPEGWVWASLDQLSWSSSYGTSVKCNYENTGTPVLRIPNIVRGKLELGDVKFAGTKKVLTKGEEVLPGDILIIRTNGSKKLIGRCVVIKERLDQPTSYASYLIRFRIHPKPSLYKWVGSVWDSPFFRNWIEQRAATSAGQHNISMSVLSTHPICLPPLIEQKRIIAEIERRLSIVEELLELVNVNFQRVNRLRQGILIAAFSGRFL